MSIRVFDYTIPALTRGLNVLLSYLEHIARHVGDDPAEAEAMLKSRLAPDMFSLGRQIQIACDNAKNGSARLSGRVPPSYADVETTVDEFRSRVQNTLSYLATFTPDDFFGSEERLIDQSFRHANYAMQGADYLRAVLLPNFYFHVAMVHAILRHRGLQLGKLDYFGELPRVHECDAFCDRVFRFITSAECSAWIAQRELPEDPAALNSRAFYFQFAPQPLDVDLRDVICSLMEDFGAFSGGLLWMIDWIWDDEYESDPTTRYRQAQGDPRPLDEVPGVLFNGRGLKEAADFLAQVIERRWTARFYFESSGTVLHLCEGDRVDVYSADAEIEQRVRYRLIESGAVFTLP
jgi:Uncharacterized protein conserved in bacteria